MRRVAPAGFARRSELPHWPLLLLLLLGVQIATPAKRAVADDQQRERFINGKKKQAEVNEANRKRRVDERAVATTDANGKAELHFIQRVTKNSGTSNSLSVDQLVLINGSGKTVVLREGEHQTMQALSVSADGTLLLFEAGNSGASDAKPRFILLKPGGTELRTIDLNGIKGMVFGSPCLLPGGTQIGFTLCKPQKQSFNPPTKTAASPNPLPFESVRPEEIQKRELLTQRMRPYIAVVDLDGKHLKEIGPGALPRWSTDGKTILFSAITMKNIAMGNLVEMRWGQSRLSLMDANGKNARPIAEEATYDGVFSPDGKQIACVLGHVDGSPVIQVCDADGSHPRELAGSMCATPRWASTGKAVFLKTAVALGSGVPKGQSIRTVDLGANRFSETSESRTVVGIDFDAESMTYAATHVNPFVSEMNKNLIKGKK